MDKVEIVTIIYNFLDMLNGLNVKFFEQPVKFYCRRGTGVFLEKAKYVARDINSHKYTKDQFIKFLFMTALLKDIKGIYSFQIKDIFKIRKITERTAIKDEEIINKICQKYGLPVEGLFEIRDNGESILFKLLKTDHITIAYALKNYKNILTIAEKNIILFNKEYSKFHKTFKKFIQYIQGESYAKIQV
jgi:hypothetical protein